MQASSILSWTITIGLDLINSAFNAEGSKWIIFAVQVGAVKIYVAAVETLRKKERQLATFTPRTHVEC